MSSTPSCGYVVFSIQPHVINEFDSILWLRRVLDTTSCDKICQWFAADWWFSPDCPVSCTSTTDHYDIHITKILLKVTLMENAHSSDRIKISWYKIALLLMLDLWRKQNPKTNKISSNKQSWWKANVYRLFWCCWFWSWHSTVVFSNYIYYLIISFNPSEIYMKWYCNGIALSP